jgi:sugar fermentation stimulation protein A
MPVWLSRSDNPKRKLAHTLELVGVEGGHVGVNALWANRLAAEALAAGVVSELTGYPVVRPEVKYGAASRVDFLLTGGGRPDCYVEVKSATLCRKERLAEWPDSVSARGARHLVELEAMVAAGNRAALFFVVQRNDCDRFDLAHDLDPAFSRALAGAMAAGVEVLVYGCDIDPAQIRISRRLTGGTAG